MKAVRKKYKEIFKLKRMLEKADIPFEFEESFGLNWCYREGFGITYNDLYPASPYALEHYHICYPDKNNIKISVIEGWGTYGAEFDRLEIMGGLTLYEQYVYGNDNPIGGLTAKNVFNRIKREEEKKNEIRR